MIDYGTRHTDLALKRLEARLRAVYRQAERDIAAKTEDYWKRHAARDEKYRQQVKDGKLSKEDYEAWQRGQVFQGDAWTARKGAIQDVLYNADTAALQMINDGKVDAFAANANYMGYALEHGENVNFSFSLYDGPTVARLLKDNPQILPKARVKKEKAYVWYNKLVNNCVLQGIIQGESIGEIAERIGKTTGERTRTAMLRNARTAYTGAQNAGRLEGMRQAEKLGVNVKKRWMATLDARTRDAHADLDGQVQDRDKPFKSPLGDIMFPGDPTAKPGLVYNCRCTITYVYPEYASAMTRRDNENGEVVGDMTYREWEAMKRGGGQAIPIKAVPVLTPADKIKATIAAHQDRWTVDELQDIGRQMRDEIDKYYVDPRIRMNEIWTQQKALFDEDEAQRERNSELNRLIKETDDKVLKKRYRQELADGRARRKEFEERGKELQAQYWAARNDDGRAKALRNMLADIRSMGGVDNGNLDRYADFVEYYDKTTDAKTRQCAVEAMNCYPSEWLDSSSRYGTPLCPHWTTGRAYYSFGTGEIRFDGANSTNVHELGHRFEQTIPGILQSEREFYTRRTAGEALEWMGPGYRQDERTRKDKFENAYMGKDYGGNAFELVSMGFQYAFTDYARLASDPDMQTWILGLLAAV